MTLPSAPSSTDPAAFEAEADAFLAALPTFETEMNALATAMNLNDTTDTSSSSVAIGTGSKTFTVSASKSFVPGMFLVVADSAAPTTNYMIVQVSSYSGTTLIVNSITYSGSGTKTSWQISFSGSIDQVLGDHEVWVHTGNGYGSTNTKINRFTTIGRNAGTAITYTDNAANGSSFTINEDGIYAITFVFYSSSAAEKFGISKNSSQLTTSIESITSTDILAVSYAVSANLPYTLCVTAKLVNGDVIRNHASAVGSFTNALASMRIIKLHAF